MKRIPRRTAEATLALALLVLAPSSARSGALPAAAVFLSPTGNDAAACTAAAPCRTLDRGYRAARPGQVVELAAGRYPGGAIGVDERKRAEADVVFRPAPRAAVTVGGELEIYGSHLTIRDLKLAEGWKTYRQTLDVTLRNVSSRHFFIWSSRRVSVVGGEVGPSDGSDYDPQISEESGSRLAPRDILIDGVDFHDWLRPAGSGFHTECLQVGAGVNVTIRRSRFRNCATHDIFIRSWGGINGGIHALKGWVLENNFFGETADGYYAIQFLNDLGSSDADFLVRSNSFLQGIHVDRQRTTVTVDSNIFSEQPAGSCGGDVYRYNVVESGVRCGPTDRIGRVRYRNRAALDLHLLPGSAGIDQGNPSGHPRSDIDGQRRPSGRRADAGADEAP
jgi:hypothetical protein